MVKYYKFKCSDSIVYLYYYKYKTLSRGNMIGNNLRKIRKKKGLSQEKLARLADISLNTLTKIESGFAKKPTIQTVVKLSKALEVKIEDLVKEES